MLLSSPESTSPALIGLPAFGTAAVCCATAAGAADVTAMNAAKASRLPNREFVMSIIPFCGV
jgi:hypothetical protein